MSKPLILELKENMQRHIITASTFETNTTAAVKVKLGLTESVNEENRLKIGNKLNLNNGSIVVGEGVKKVLVSGKILIDESQITNTFLYLTLNGLDISRVGGYGIYNTLNIATRIVNVKEGDVLGIAVVSGTNAKVYSDSYLTVEVVE